MSPNVPLHRETIRPKNHELDIRMEATRKTVRRTLLHDTSKVYNNEQKKFPLQLITFTKLIDVVVPSMSSKIAPCCRCCRSADPFVPESSMTATN